MRILRKAGDVPKRSLWQKIKDVALMDVAVLARGGVSPGNLERLEEILLESDIGVPTTLRLVEEVERLASRGFVTRRRDPSDRRVVVVDLEPGGRLLVERLFPAHSERVTAAFEKLDESEKRTFSELCRKLAA